MLRSIRTSIATVSISGTLPEKLKAIKAAGFDGVEIFENDLLYFDGTPVDVHRMCEDLGLAIYLFQPFRDFEGVAPERLARNVERAKRKFELMHELGTDRMLAWGPSREFVQARVEASSMPLNQPSLGLVLDTFHTMSIRDSIDEIASIPGDRIAFVQIADAPVMAMDVLEWSRHYRCFPG